MGAYYSSGEKISEEVLQAEWATLLKDPNSLAQAAQKFNSSKENAGRDDVVKFIASHISSGEEQEVLIILEHLPTAFNNTSETRLAVGICPILLSLVHILLRENPNSKLSSKVIQTLNATPQLYNIDTDGIKVKFLSEAGVLDQLIALIGTNKNLLVFVYILMCSKEFCERMVAASQTLQQLYTWTNSNGTLQERLTYACSFTECCADLVSGGILECIDKWYAYHAYCALERLHKQKAQFPTATAKKIEWMIFQTSLRCMEQDHFDEQYMDKLLKNSDVCLHLQSSGAIELTLTALKKKSLRPYELIGKILKALHNGKVSAIHEATQRASVPFEDLPVDLSKEIFEFVRANAVTNIRDEDAPWYINPALLPTPQSHTKKYCIVPGTPRDLAFVAGMLEKNPVPGHDLKSVQIVSSDHLSVMFTGRIALLESRHKNKAFQPTWELYTTDPQEIEQRKQTSEMLMELAKPYFYERTPAVKYVPLWHGTNPAVLDSVFTTGFANLAKTDAGFFGKGLYSTVEAEYAYRVYSAGTLLLNWVAFYSAYPVIAKDEVSLAEKGNFENYDAHFVPVYSPRHPKTSNYHACKVGEKHQYTEMVVFESSQMLPHFIVELQPSLPRSPPLSIILPAGATTNPSPNANENVTDTSNRKPTPNSNIISAQAAKNDSNLQAKPVNEWTVDEVCAWVSTLDLSQSYTNELKANHINGKVLKSMIKIDWQDIGVTKFGDIRNLILDVAKLL